MKRIEDIYKLRLGKKEYKDLLRKAKLPTNMLENERFIEIQRQLKSCPKHGATPTEEQTSGCLVCQVLTSKIVVNFQQRVEKEVKDRIKEPLDDEKRKTMWPSQTGNRSKDSLTSANGAIENVDLNRKVGLFSKNGPKSGVDGSKKRMGGEQ